MNKDTIYIEPADDITDIIAKIKGSEEKVVALVPPKKLGVLASAINIKLIAKAAKSTDKAVVLVTDNPSLMKLCAMSALPVAETLQSRPAVPTADDIARAEQGGEKMTIAEAAEEAEARDAKEELAKEFTAEPESSAELFDEQIKVNNPELDSAEIEDELAEDAAKAISAETPIVIDENAEQEAPADAKSSAPAEKSAGKKIIKWVIAGAVATAAIVALLVWAFVFAPAADVIVSVGTTSANFSENISFTTQRDEEDASSGKFYLETLEYKETLSSSVSATADKDVGDKAKGKLEVSFTFKSNATTSITVPANSTFIQGGLKYTNAEKATLALPSTCTVADLNSNKCTVSVSIDVTAAEPGEKYNCEKNMSWTTTVGGLSVSNKSALTGGSSKVVKVVQQSDFDTAKSNLKKLSESEAKSILAEQLSSGYVLIDSSYQAVGAEPQSNVELGKETNDDSKLEQEITYTIYAVDSERIAEFIRAKANLASDQKIYELGDPYIERFSTSGDNITGKLKTAYKVGPEITSDIILEKVRGKKTGEAFSMLQSINGVKSVKIDTSFFWVNSVPDDANKVHITLQEIQ